MDSAPQNRYDTRARRHSGARPAGDAAGPASHHAAPPPVPPQQPAPQYAPPPYPQAPQYQQSQYQQSHPHAPASQSAQPQSPSPQQSPSQASTPGYGWNPTTVQVQVFPQQGSSSQQEAGSQPPASSGSHSPPLPSAQVVSTPAAPAPPPPAEHGYYPQSGHQYAAPPAAAPQYPAESQYPADSQYTGTSYPAEHDPPEHHSGQPGGWSQPEDSYHGDHAPPEPQFRAEDQYHPGSGPSQAAYQPADSAGYFSTDPHGGYDTAYDPAPQTATEESVWSGWADATDEPGQLVDGHGDSSAGDLHSRQDQPDSPHPQGDSPSAAPAPPLWACFSRGVGLFLGLLALAAVAGELRSPLFDGSLWWIDLGRLPLSVSRGLLSAFGVLAVTFGVLFHLPSLFRRLALSVTVVVLLLTLSNVVACFQALRGGTIASEMPLPLSLHVAACLALLARGLLLSETTGGRTFRNGVLTFGTLGLCAVAFPLCQIFCDGQTDHRQPAAAIAVFGCGIDEQGRPSDALRDRMRTAAELYHAGLAPSVILSGGPGPGTVHETEAMQTLARSAGIPATAVHVHREGYDTLSTVRHLAAALPNHNAQSPRVLLVSHFFHLPRIATYSRQHGLNPLTVPAPQQAILRRLPWFVAREIPALWVSHARSLTMRHYGQPVAAASPPGEPSP